ncbi:hypothetical protein BLJAPNOD_01758 [Ensifer sp. M14]|nr:hypothetical protein BLJAPNOD_01758 [Ensifer sp. M14]
MKTTRPEDLTLAEILVRKAEARRELSRLSFGEKVRIVEGMRERLAAFNRIRERRKAAERSTPAPSCF